MSFTFRVVCERTDQTMSNQSASLRSTIVSPIPSDFLIVYAFPEAPFPFKPGKRYEVTIRELEESEGP